MASAKVWRRAWPQHAAARGVGPSRRRSVCSAPAGGRPSPTAPRRRPAVAGRPPCPAKALDRPNRAAGQTGRTGPGRSCLPSLLEVVASHELAGRIVHRDPTGPGRSGRQGRKGPLTRRSASRGRWRPRGLLSGRHLGPAVCARARACVRACVGVSLCADRARD